MGRVEAASALEYVSPMLKRFYADNFRCLVNFEFRPAAVNLLVGRNGSGKSTFWEALSAIKQVISGASPASIFGPGTLPWWDTRRLQTFEVDWGGPQDAPFKYRLVVRHRVEGASIQEESLELGGQPLLTFSQGRVRLFPSGKLPVDFSYAGRQSILSAGFGESAPLGAFVGAMAGVATFRLNPWSMQAASPIEASGLAVDGSNFVSWLRSFAQDDPDLYSSWREVMAEVLPQFSSLKLVDLGGPRLLKGVTRLPGGAEVELPFSDFSEGERCLSVLHAITARRRRASALLLDEPDSFVSMDELQPLLGRLVEPGADRPQVFVISHHPEAIDYLSDGSTWLFRREASGAAHVASLEFDRERGERPSTSVQLELS